MNNKVVVSLISDKEQIDNYWQKDVSELKLPQVWYFMSIQNSHIPSIQKHINTPKSRETQITFHTPAYSTKHTELFKTNVLENVIAIEIINEVLYVENEKGENMVFYTTVHLLGAYMTNSNILLDKSYWSTQINAVDNIDFRKAFNFEKKDTSSLQIRSEATSPSVLVSSPLVEQEVHFTSEPRDIADIFTEMENIYHFHIQNPEYKIHIGSTDNRSRWLGPGFYSKEKCFYNNGKLIEIQSVTVPDKVQLTVFDTNKIPIIYNEKNSKQSFLKDWSYMAIQVSKTILTTKPSDGPPLEIYTMNKIYPCNHLFEVDVLQNVVSIVLRKTFITFCDNTGTRHTFYNNVYFLPGYLNSDNNHMNLTLSTWKSLSDNMEHKFLVQSVFKNEQQRKEVASQVQAEQVPVSYTKPETAEDLTKFNFIETTEKEKENSNAVVTSDNFQRYPDQADVRHVVPLSQETYAQLQSNIIDNLPETSVYSTIPSTEWINDDSKSLQTQTKDSTSDSITLYDSGFVDDSLSVKTPQLSPFEPALSNLPQDEKITPEIIDALSPTVKFDTSQGPLPPLEYQPLYKRKIKFPSLLKRKSKQNVQPNTEPESDLLIETVEETESTWLEPQSGLLIESVETEPMTLEDIQKKKDDCEKHNSELQNKNTKYGAKIKECKTHESDMNTRESNMKTQLDQCTLEKIKLKENSDFYFYLAIGFIFLVVPLFFVFFLYFMKSTTN